MSDAEQPSAHPPPQPPAPLAAAQSALTESQRDNSAALRKEIEALRGLLAAQRAEVARLKADLDRMSTYDQRQQRVISEYAAELARFRSPATSTYRAYAAASSFSSVVDHRQLVDVLYREKNEAVATARAEGEQSMRDTILRWHDEQRVKYRDLSGTNGIAGAHMGAHEESIAAIRALAIPVPQEDDNGTDPAPGPAAAASATRAAAEPGRGVLQRP